MGTDDSPHVCTRFSPAPASIPSSPGSHSNSTQIIPKNGVCPYFYYSVQPSEFLVRAALSPRSGHCVLACSSPALRPLMLLSALRPPMLLGALRLACDSLIGGRRTVDGRPALTNERVTGSHSSRPYRPLSFLSGSLSKKKDARREVSKNRFPQRTAFSVCCPCGSFPAKRALRPGMIFASLGSTDAPQCIATADALRRIASCNF